MKKSELQKIIREEISKALKETYYNPEWKLTSIQDWIETYAMNNRLNFKLLKKVDKKSGTGSKTTFYVYDIGDKHGIVIKDDKVAGAPRLSEIDVIVGLKGSALGSLSKSYTISGTDGSQQELIKLLDKVLGIKEGQELTEDWKTTIAKAVIKKDKNKFNQYTFDVVDNGKVLATYTPERNFVEIHTPEALEFFKHTFKELGIRPIEDKAGGEGKVTSYTLKDAGNMKLLKSIMSMSKSKIVVEAQLDLKNQKLKDRYIDAYVTLTIDPYAFDESDDWENAPTYEDIKAHAKKFGYEDTLKTIDKMEDVRSLRNKFGPAGNQEDPLKAKTPGTWVDNLSMRDPLMYLTKAGKMNKLDVDRLKLRIKKNLGLK